MEQGDNISGSIPSEAHVSIVWIRLYKTISCNSEMYRIRNRTQQLREGKGLLQRSSEKNKVCVGHPQCCPCVPRSANPPILQAGRKNGPFTYSKYSAAGVVPKVSLRPRPSLELLAWASEQLGLFQVLLQWIHGRSMVKEEKK